MSEIIVHVQPNARRNEVKGVEEGFIRVRVVAPPVRNEANKELVAFLSHILGLRKSDSEIVEGMTSKRKVVAIHGLGQEQILPALNRREKM
jgi:hypothetical protein